MSELRRFQIEQHRWANRTFGDPAKGYDRPPEGAIAHLKKEVGELHDDPYDLAEYADCLMLLLDAASSAGFTSDEVLNSAWNKLAINRDREWGEPDMDGAVEHIR